MYNYILFFSALGLIAAVDVPSFLTQCSIDDGSCLAKTATNTLHNILNGYKTLGVPSLNPIDLPLVQLKGPTLNLDLVKLNVYGIDTSEITSVKFDPAKKTGEVKVLIKNAQLISDYKLTGKISILAIDGGGRSNITTLENIFTWRFNYDFEEKNGHKYLKITKDETTFTIKKCFFQFNDLFKNDEVLTKSTNDILNQGWESVIGDWGSGISETFGGISRLCASAIFSRIPFIKLINS